MPDAGGLTHNQRQRLFRLNRQLGQHWTNFYMRLNDDWPQSKRSRTISARKMKEISRDIYRVLTGGKSASPPVEMKQKGKQREMGD